MNKCKHIHRQQLARNQTNTKVGFLYTVLKYIVFAFIYKSYSIALKKIQI